MENALGTSSCIAIQIEIELDTYEDKKVVLTLGEEESESEIFSALEKFDNIEKIERSLKDTKEYWNGILRKVQVKTNEPKIDFMLNRMGYVSDNSM